MSAIEFSPEDLERRFVRAKYLRSPSKGSDETAEEIATAIARKYGATLDEVRRKGERPRRFKHLTDARREIYQALLARGWTTSAVGDFVGVDHSTIVKVLAYRPKGAE